MRIGMVVWEGLVGDVLIVWGIARVEITVLIPRGYYMGLKG